MWNTSLEAMQSVGEAGLILAVGITHWLPLLVLLFIAYRRTARRRAARVKTQEVTKGEVSESESEL